MNNTTDFRFSRTLSVGVASASSLRCGVFD